MKNRLTLRKYKNSDLKQHLSLLIMNNVYKIINPKIKENEKDWLKKSIKNYKKQKPDFFVLAICLDKKIIGNIIIEKINYSRKSGNIGYWIGKKWWQKNYSTMTLKLFLKRVNKKFKIKKVYAETNSKNVASSKVLEKNGFKKLRRKKNKLHWEKELG